MSPNVLHFTIKRFDDEDGIYYVVSGVESALTTDGPTIEEALRNLRAAIELYYQGGNLTQLPRLEIA